MQSFFQSGPWPGLEKFIFAGLKFPVIMNAYLSKFMMYHEVHRMSREGYSYLFKVDWNNFHDGAILDQALEKYREVYGCYPKRVLGDRLYGNRENRRLLKQKGIQFVGRSLGRPSAEQKQREKLLIKEMAGFISF